MGSPIRWVRRSDGLRRWGGSGLAENPVHLCAADRADPLGHPAAVRFMNLAVEIALLLAFDAVAVVGLGHWPSFRQGRHVTHVDARFTARSQRSVDRTGAHRTRHSVARRGFPIPAGKEYRVHP